MQDIYDYLKASIPTDYCGQSSASSVLAARLKQGFSPAKVLDFGCGDGRSIKLFRELSPKASWTGVDIAFSPEVSQRSRTDGNFVTYDGYEMPFANESFDLVYSHQVLEHVRKPELALREIRRVLKASGLFIGQTSQFEPYHSFSLWNFTIYGFKKIVEDAGLHLLEIRPGIDGFTLMQRTYAGRPPEMSKYFSEESPINAEIEKSGHAAGKSKQVINYRKLMYAGQFTFVIQRQS